jgi:hypothetical protein
MMTRSETQKQLKQAKLQSKGLAISLGILGILFFSSKAVMVKLAYLYEVDSVSLLLLRMLFSVPFYVVIALLQKPLVDKNPTPRDYYLLIGFGIIGYYLASYFDFLGLTYIKASLERLILFKPDFCDSDYLFRSCHCVFIRIESRAKRKCNFGFIFDFFKCPYLCQLFGWFGLAHSKIWSYAVHLLCHDYLKYMCIRSLFIYKRDS